MKHFLIGLVGVFLMIAPMAIAQQSADTVKYSTR